VDPFFARLSGRGDGPLASETGGLSVLALLFVCAAAVMLRSRRTPATL
jgi:hypothetical protein